jgi:hypothetical protein
MSLLLEQVNEPVYAVDSSSGTQNQISKYILKCEFCLWKISFYEPTESMYLDNKNMKCPMCKEIGKKSLKILQ